MEYRVDEKILGAMVQSIAARRYTFTEWREAKRDEAIVKALNGCEAIEGSAEDEPEDHGPNGKGPDPSEVPAEQ